MLPRLTELFQVREDSGDQQQAGPESDSKHSAIPPAKEKVYFDLLGRCTFAASQRDKAPDEEDREYWRDRRRKLAADFDRFAKSNKLPTLADIHTGKGMSGEG